MYILLTPVTSNLSYCIMLIIVHYTYARSRGARTREYDGPQASSCEETNIFFLKQEASAGTSHLYSLTFILNQYLCYSLFVH
jgi:hypothetical protein